MNDLTIITTDNVESSSQTSAIKVGLSACLAGQSVRYNGGHAQSRMCLNVLSQYFDFKTFCPEMAAGFGTPRPTMRLVGDPEAPQLVYSDGDGENLTEQLVNGFADKLDAMAELDGYILMKNSPSCGMERIKVYQDNGYPHVNRTAGLFTQALQAKFPLMPIEEEGRLHDDRLFDNFIVRVYAYSNFRREVLAQPSLHNLMQFHSSYKYLLMAHSYSDSKALGRLLGEAHKGSLDETINRYFAEFMQLLAKPASRKKHTNVLLHLLGYLKKSVASEARQSIVDVIYKYKDGIVPLVTPLTLLSHYFEQHGSSYIKAQRYLNPYPESMHPIRRHV